MTSTPSPLRVPPVREERVRRGPAAALRSALTRLLDAQGPLVGEPDQLAFARDNLSLLERHAPEVVAGARALREPGGPEVFIAHDLPGSEGRDDLRVSEVVSLMIAESFGGGHGPMQFRQEKGGRLISVLAVHPERANEQSGQGQREFEHHVDFSHSATGNGRPDEDGRPAFVILAGVRSDGTATTYASAAEVVATALSPETLGVLTERRFETPMPAEMGLGAATSGPKAVLWKTRGGEWGVSVRSSTRPLRADDAEAAEALGQFQAAIRRHERRFVVQRDTYVITSNLRGSHARGEITNPGERLVLRTYVGPLAALRENAHLFDLHTLLPRATRNGFRPKAEESAAGVTG